MIRVSPTSILLAIVASTHADTTLTTSVFPGGTSAVGAYTLASVYGQSSSLEAMSAANQVLDPGFLCIEADDVPIPGDINRDGSVNGIDIAIVVGNWGPCPSTDCVADVDGDGVVNAIDLAYVLFGWTG